MKKLLLFLLISHSFIGTAYSASNTYICNYDMVKTQGDKAYSGYNDPPLTMIVDRKKITVKRESPVADAIVTSVYKVVRNTETFLGQFIIAYKDTRTDISSLVFRVTDENGKTVNELSIADNSGLIKYALYGKCRR